MTTLGPQVLAEELREKFERREVGDEEHVFAGEHHINLRRRNMKIRIVLLVVLVSVLALAFGTGSLAEGQCQAWQVTIGGEDADAGYSVQQTSDGGYILLGYTESYGAGEKDFWLVKTDSNGNKQWDKTFGGSEYDEGHSIQLTRDGGYILLGWTMSYGAGEKDFWLIKTDARGKKQWDRTFGGKDDDAGFSVQQTSDGGYVLVGYSYITEEDPQPWLIKTDASGKKEWDRTFEGAKSYSVQQTSDGGYIILGSYGYFHLIKTDEKGRKDWDRTFGHKGARNKGKSVQQTSDGGYILSGGSYSWSGSACNDWLIKTDGGGSKEWRANNWGCAGNSVQQTPDGGYIYVGSDNIDFWVVKTDTDGSMEWEETFGSGEAYSVQLTSDGGYISVGYMYDGPAGWDDVWLIKSCPP